MILFLSKHMLYQTVELSFSGKTQFYHWESHGGSLGVPMVTLLFLHHFRRGWACLNHVASLGEFSGVWSFGDPWGGPWVVPMVTLPFLKRFGWG